MDLKQKVHNRSIIYIYMCVCVTATCRVTRQGWLYGPHYTLLLTLARALIIAMCRVRDVVQKAGMPGINSGVGDRMVILYSSVPRGKIDLYFYVYV